MGALPCPGVSSEEVANACGLEDTHDGVNYMRAACVIAMAKAHELLEPFIHQVRSGLVRSGQVHGVRVRGLAPFAACLQPPGQNSCLGMTTSHSIQLWCVGMAPNVAGWQKTFQKKGGREGGRHVPPPILCALQLGHRLSHVLRRLHGIALFLLAREAALPAGQEPLLRRVTAAFNAFIDSVEKACKDR